MTAITVEQFPCLMYERNNRLCGDTYYQFVTEGHAVGACCKHHPTTGAPLKFAKADLPLTAKKTAQDGTLQLQLLTAKGDVVFATAISENT